MRQSVVMGFILGSTFSFCFVLGYIFLPAPDAWGKVLALLALVNAMIGLGYLIAQHPPK